MNIDLSKLNKESESETLELKESFDTKVLETIGAFANATGGTILIGVRDDGHVTGIVLGSNSLEEWAQRMQAKIQPRTLPSISKLAHEKRTVVAITVERADSPISVDGRYVKRVGRTNQIMGPDEIKQRLLASSPSSWDSQIVKDATFGDLNDETLDEFISLVSSARRRPLGAERADEVLTKLGLAHDTVPTRAAILLFGKHPSKFFGSAFLQLGRFKSPTQIVDSKRIEGNIIQQIKEGMIWFEQRLQTEFIITGKAVREEKWEYPLPAVREALINAVCHRDYAAAGSAQVRLYDDRFEIWNPGGLPIPLTPERLLEKHPSMPRNRLIADSLFYAGFIESWG
ncbi:MAG: RNA-binding domain-containing protein, partial [Terriglobales bacterium]